MLSKQSILFRHMDPKGEVPLEVNVVASPKQHELSTLNPKPFTRRPGRHFLSLSTYDFSTETLRVDDINPSLPAIPVIRGFL